MNVGEVDVGEIKRVEAKEKKQATQQKWKMLCSGLVLKVRCHR